MQADWLAYGVGDAQAGIVFFSERSMSIAQATYNASDSYLSDGRVAARESSAVARTSFPRAPGQRN